jgi:hypothetical protein
VTGPKAWGLLRRCLRTIAATCLCGNSRVNFPRAPETFDWSRYHKSAGICAAHEKWGLGFFEVYLPQVLLAALLKLAEVGCFIWNNLYSMRNDSRPLKDAAVSGNENAYNSFLPRDTTLDELIASGSRFVTAVDLWALSLLTHHLIRKLELIQSATPAWIKRSTRRFSY